MRFSKLKAGLGGLIAAGAGLLPFVASAAGSPAGIGSAVSTLQSIEAIFAAIVRAGIPLLFGIAVIVFFVGLIGYIRKPEHKEGVKVMIAGIVGIFVMACLWGIIALLGGTLGVSTTNNLQLQPPVVQGL